MQIRKTYHNVSPELLHDEIKDFTVKQGRVIDGAKLGTYSLPTASSSFIFRGILTFRAQSTPGKGEKECLRAHIAGSTEGETKVMLDTDEKFFPQERTDALLNDLDFIFSLYEVKDGKGLSK